MWATSAIFNNHLMGESGHPVCKVVENIKKQKKQTSHRQMDNVQGDQKRFWRKKSPKMTKVKK
jgi:hypothetical protein